MSWNKNITWDFIQKNLDKWWDWRGICCNHNITMENVDANVDEQWDWWGICRLPFNYDKEVYIKKRKFVQDNLLEEFVKYYMRPERIIMILETMNIDADQLDEYL